MDIKVDLTKRGAIKDLKKLYAGRDARFKDLMIALGRVGVIEIRKQIKLWTAASNTGLSTGALSESFKLESLTISGKVGRVVIGSDSAYAHIHNVGGTIYGKPYLAIPGPRAIKFFTGKKGYDPVTPKDLTSQGNFLIKQAVITPKNYMFNAEKILRSTIPEIARITIRTAWEGRGISSTSSISIGGTP